MLGSIEYEDDLNLYPFKVRVGVAKYRPPRHEYFDFLRDMGSVHVSSVLRGKPLSNHGCLTFVFPERWMSVHEQQSFMNQLRHHPEVDKIEQVDIITNSPLMVSNFSREMIRILEWPDDDQNYHPFI
jgi:hypothetical protein